MSPLTLESFRQGTLITPNFEILGKTALKALSATSPEFVPASPLKLAHFPKVENNPPKNRTSKGLQAEPEMTKSLQRAEASCLVYNEFGKFEDTSTSSMEKEVVAISVDLIQPIFVGSLESSKTNALQDKIDALIISSNSSRPEKNDSNRFPTPFMSKETPASTPSPIPTGPRPGKSRFGRADKKKKDIIITQFGIVRNLARITEQFTDNGFPYKHVCADEFEPQVYDVADVVRKMSLGERKDFWTKNWIDIEVDMRTEKEVFGINAQIDESEQAPRDYGTLLRYVDCLGPDFAAHAKYIFISILFSSISEADQSKVNSSVSYSQNTPEFQHLEKLVAKLQHFPKIKRLDVILQTPSNTKKPLSIPQLNLVLPFYDLGFTDWNIKWKTSFMTKAEPVGGWPIHYLDKERNRLLRERERVKNAVFVRKSEFVK